MIDSNKVGRRIRERREALNMTQEMLGDILGLHKSTIQRYESGEVSRIKIPVIQSMANALLVSPLWLSGFTDDPTPIIKTDNNTIPITGMIPVFGSIPAGVPAFAEQYIEDYLPTTLKNPEDYSSLRVKGESMIGAGIPNGAKVVLKKQSTAENGQIVACRVNGDEATLKRFRQDGSTILLMPENSDFSPIILNASQFENGYAEILGVVKQIVIDVS